MAMTITDVRARTNAHALPTAERANAEGLEARSSSKVPIIGGAAVGALALGGVAVALLRRGGVSAPQAARMTALEHQQTALGAITTARQEFATLKPSTAEEISQASDLWSPNFVNPDAEYRFRPLYTTEQAERYVGSYFPTDAGLTSALVSAREHGLAMVDRALAENPALTTITEQVYNTGEVKIKLGNVLRSKSIFEHQTELGTARHIPQEIADVRQSINFAVDPDDPYTGLVKLQSDPTRNLDNLERLITKFDLAKWAPPAAAE